MNLISILIVDDRPIVLEGLKSLFQDLEEILIDTESNPENVIIKMQHSHFDVLLIDGNMAVKNGISVVADIKATQENALIILYTGDDVSSYYPLILEKKVDGLLSKTATSEKVIKTIHSIIQGDLLLPVDFIDYINKRMQNKYNNLTLTDKEKQLMSMLIEGYTNKMIAKKLGVTQRTAERYLTQLFAMLGVPSRGEAVEFVKEKQLL